MPLRIGNAAGFLGDSLDAPRRLVNAAHIDYLTLEYLAELTLSILARARQKDPAAGYAGDFLDVLRSLCPILAAQPGLKIVTNAGGMNPVACARETGKLLAASGLADVRLGVVSGDDLLPELPKWQAAGCHFSNLDTGEPLATLTAPVASANAYLGARPIAEALASGALIVITGRVADASLTVGPAMHEFGWPWDDWQKLAGASVAGHLIECGAQVTGGYSYLCGSTGDSLADIGYPIVELEPDGSCVVTKPPGTGGIVSRAAVVEQLTYEIGDPRHYLTPDVGVDFTTVDLTDVGPDRVAVTGATGRPAPAQYKVSLAYQAGYTASGQLLVYGRRAAAKARACGELIRRRLAAADCVLDRFHIECLGAGDAVPGVPPAMTDFDDGVREVMLRVTVSDPRREVVERFTKEFAPLITSGPAGLAGYASGRPVVRPVFAYWPALVPRDLVDPRIQVRVQSAAEWSRATT